MGKARRPTAADVQRVQEDLGLAQALLNETQRKLVAATAELTAALKDRDFWKAHGDAAARAAREAQGTVARLHLLVACKDVALDKADAALALALESEDGLDGSVGEPARQLVLTALHAEVRSTL